MSRPNVECPYVSQTGASIVGGWIKAGLAAVHIDYVRVNIRSESGSTNVEPDVADVLPAKRCFSFLRISDLEISFNWRASSSATLIQISRRGNGCRGWFCRRSVVLVFAGFRTWRFVRARSATRVGGRGRIGRPRAMRPGPSARR